MQKLLTGDSKGFIPDTLDAGKLLLITAPMREGKSNCASWIMENASALNYNVYTNFLFFEPDEIEEAIKEGILKQKKGFYRRVPPEIHTVTSASELFRGLFSTYHNITILDEALIYAGSKRGTAKELRWFEEFVTQIGKLDSSLALIAQVKSKLAKMLKADLPSFEIKVYKMSFNNRYAEIWYNPPQDVDDPEEPHKVDEWNNLPPSRYPYDHKAPAGFNFDINMEDFINRISKLNSLKVRKQIPIILDEMIQNKTNNDNGNISKKQIISKMMVNNPSIGFNDVKKALKIYFNETINEGYFYRIKQELNII